MGGRVSHLGLAVDSILEKPGRRPQLAVLLAHGLQLRVSDPPVQVANVERGHRVLRHVRCPFYHRGGILARWRLVLVEGLHVDSRLVVLQRRRRHGHRLLARGDVLDVVVEAVIRHLADRVAAWPTCRVGDTYGTRVQIIAQQEHGRLGPE